MALVHAIFGIMTAGICFEVLATSVLDFRRTKSVKLEGVSYLWMFPLYALATFAFFFGLIFFDNYSICIRGIFYALVFLCLELFYGLFIRKLVGTCPWDYSNYSINFFGRKIKSNFKGVICLQYLPAWYIYSLVGEIYYLALISL